MHNVRHGFVKPTEFCYIWFMKISYRLCASQEQTFPAFFEKPALSSQTTGKLDRNEVAKALQQLQAGAAIHVTAMDDPVAISELVFELTFGATRVVNQVGGLHRSIPGHLYILFAGQQTPHKIW
jgi:hypothetical protein